MESSEPRGARVTVLVTGVDIPVALIRAAGFEPEHVTVADAERRSTDPSVAAIVFSHLRDSDAQAYHRLRYRAGAGETALLFLDLPASDGEAQHRYAVARLRSLAERLAKISGFEVTDDRLRAELAHPEAAPAASIADGPVAALVGLDGPARDLPEPATFTIRWRELEQGYGAAPAPALDNNGDPWEAMAQRHAVRAATTSRASLELRVAAIAEHAHAAGVAVILLDAGDVSDSAVWFRSVLRLRLGDQFQIVTLGESTPTVVTKPSPDTPAERPRARKLLSFADGFSQYQREWFAGIRQRALSGEPFAVVNADAPQEVLRALDIPFVVNQWWASIVAAKGSTAAYQAALARAGLPAREQAYNSQGLAEAIGVGEPLPWEGLPRPAILSAMRAEDAVAGIFEQWAERTGAEVLLFDRTIESRAEFPLEWWDLMADGWEEVIEPERLDLLAAQLTSSVTELERISGRTLDPARLREVLDLVNEQEEWFRRTRDLIARTRPAPVSIVDTIPATMIPQWHRGTEWGRDAARAFHDEVESRIAAGLGASTDERLRLMWVGRGMWEQMWIYQAFEESHGAVFVWSMYLGLAADGYLRHMREGQNPLRALASRFVTVGDELRMPAWASAWHVAEARRHQVDAAIAIADAEPAVIAALRQAGIPVLELGIDNLTLGEPESLLASIREFLDTL
ncbi:MAG: 2-hydroxyacyl-CoA dehydratase family protein [Pseudolysinimonas sp.]|uniref:2-hydroxyacyl-CoA dehydratase family protein n=1 Tax=Pseudolysinimonas sp. TaxID=2680009 RepID=UPI003265D861